MNKAQVVSVRARKANNSRPRRERTNGAQRIVSGFTPMTRLQALDPKASQAEALLRESETVVSAVMKQLPVGLGSHGH